MTPLTFFLYQKILAGTLSISVESKRRNEILCLPLENKQMCGQKSIMKSNRRNRIPAFIQTYTKWICIPLLHKVFIHHLSLFARATQTTTCRLFLLIIIMYANYTSILPGGTSALDKRCKEKRQVHAGTGRLRGVFVIPKLVLIHIRRGNLIIHLLKYYVHLYK